MESDEMRQTENRVQKVLNKLVYSNEEPHHPFPADTDLAHILDADDGDSLAWSDLANDLNNEFYRNNPQFVHSDVSDLCTVGDLIRMVTVSLDS